MENRLWEKGDLAFFGWEDWKVTGFRILFFFGLLFGIWLHSFELIFDRIGLDRYLNTILIVFYLVSALIEMNTEIKT